MTYTDIKERWKGSGASWLTRQFYWNKRCFGHIDFLFPEIVENQDVTTPILKLNHDNGTAQPFEFQTNLLKVGRKLYEEFGYIGTIDYRIVQYIVSKSYPAYIINPTDSATSLVDMVVESMGCGTTIAGISTDEAMLLKLNDPEALIYFHEDV